MNTQVNLEERHIMYLGIRVLVVLESVFGEWSYRLFIDGEEMPRASSFKPCDERERAFSHARTRALRIINCRFN